MNAQDREDALVLGVLEAVDGYSGITQRRLAQSMGVALGLANSYLKRCVRKGLIKIQQAPANRYLYYLTPKGFAEKSRLTVRYLAGSLEFYRKASDSCLRVLTQCQSNGWRRVLLCGASDLAEITLLRATETGIEVIGVYDPWADGTSLMARPVWRHWDAVAEHNACVLTDLRAPIELYELLAAYKNRGQILVPDVLRLM